jgi:hypothetical protein
MPANGTKNLIPAKKGERRNPLGINGFTKDLFGAQVRKDMEKGFDRKAYIVAKKIFNDPRCSPQVRLNALSELLDRGYGKPSQHIDHTTGGQPIKHESIYNVQSSEQKDKIEKSHFDADTL